ncbi:SDR family oxidoreductase [Flagellimonas sp. CMM7]|uniref:SDR family oxidoreductase n=1 Tax=Flagellimonas sp. CMM7 TaxID=2654676 RepID=UPI0013D4F6AD|nr:SDR family oxidoreductase [Flagellimonas sp. CMM7]UII79872.1 SDR family oxidoreductase [Flagellimonas sp. CMM7]
MFDSKVVIVTGGSAGIGKEAALAFAKHGAKVVVASRRTTEGEETVHNINIKGGEAIFVKTDVANADEVQKMVRNTIRHYGQLNMAFNNAGIEGTPFVNAQDYDLEVWNKVLDINLKGVWLCMKYQIPELLKNSGAIVNNASGAGLRGGLAGAAYHASKHGVVGVTRSAALEYADKGIRINAVCPAVIQTSMAERAFFHDNKLTKLAIEMHPIGRIGKPNEVVDAVLWLCSEKASFITGHALPIDGGALI